MKRFSFFLSALAVALFSSCNKVEVPAVNDTIFGTVPVTVEQPIDPSTKVVINESGDTFTLLLTESDFFGLTQCASVETSSHAYKKWTYNNGSLSGEIPSDYSGSYLVILGYQDVEDKYNNGLGGTASTIRGSISVDQKSSSVKGLLIAKTEECAEGNLPSVFNFKTMNSFLKFAVKKSEEAGNVTLETITIASDSQIAGQFGFKADEVNLETGFNDESITKKYNTITLDCEHAALSTDANAFYASLAYGQLEALTVTFTFSDKSTIVKTIGKNGGVTLERNTVYSLPVITYTGAGSSNPGPEEETVSADFIFNTEAGLTALGINKPTSGNGKNLGSDIYTSGSINMTATDGGTATRVWNSSGNTNLRIYTRGSITFSGATIKKIEFSGSSLDVFTADGGDYSNGSWSGSATSVKFTATNNLTINTIKVTYVGTGESTPDPQPTTYKVSVATSVVNGTVSVDSEDAAAGQTVTITATPANGYTVKSVSAETASGTALTVTDNKFTMPAEAVTVSAEFVANSAESIITITPELFASSYDNNEKSFEISGVTFGYKAMCYNGQGSPSGWASKQLIQARKESSKAISGRVYNKTAIAGIKSVVVYMCPSDNQFTLYYGDSETSTANSLEKSSAVRTSQSMDYSTYSKDSGLGTGTTSAAVYTFDLTSESPSYIYIVNGSSANYFKRIEIKY